jgi:hypothetical protein
MRRTWRNVVICICTVAAGVGCSQQKMDMQNMKPPERPKELDQLESWVGKWEGTGEMTMHGKVMKSDATSEISWDLDKRILVERMNETMGEMKMSGMGIYMYNTREKEFKSAYVNNMGGTAHGELKYDDKTKSWKMTMKGRMMDGADMTTGEGTFKMPDANTMEWTWTEWDSWHLTKMGEGKGIMHRKG